VIRTAVTSQLGVEKLYQWQYYATQVAYGEK